MKWILLPLLLCSTSALAVSDTYIVITDRAPPQKGVTETFTADFVFPNAFTTGIKPTWSVSGAVATFIYADSSQKTVHIIFPSNPPSGQILLSVTAVVPEVPPITVNETKTINIGGP